MKSWKTTVGGILLAIGTPLSASGEGIYQTIGVLMAAVGAVMLGITARDNNVSSEDAGVK
jgi:hypothetical protein